MDVVRRKHSNDEQRLLNSGISTAHFCSLLVALRGTQMVHISCICAVSLYFTRLLAHDLAQLRAVAVGMASMSGSPHNQEHTQLPNKLLCAFQLTTLQPNCIVDTFVFLRPSFDRFILF